MVGAALALIVVGLLLAGWSVWRLGAQGDFLTALFFFIAFMLGLALLLTGVITLAVLGLWVLLG